jgi:hypothetical protein
MLADTEDLKAAGLGAPFCVDVVKDGCRVGVLRGNLTMTSLDSLATAEAQMRLAERVFERKRSTVSCSLSSRDVDA